jgi:hypothetical protein
MRFLCYVSYAAFICPSHEFSFLFPLHKKSGHVYDDTKNAVILQLFPSKISVAAKLEPWRRSNQAAAA